MCHDHRADAVMLEGVCINYQNAVEAGLIVAEQGLIITQPVVNKSGEVVGEKYKKHPAAEISNQSWRLVRMFCSEFGLSPVSLARLPVETTDEAEEDLLEILSSPRQRSGPVQ